MLASRSRKGNRRRARERHRSQNMARRQICALLLVAAASADVNETAASESRVRALAGQSYDWLADRAPAAKAFAAQAAAQHGPT